MDYFNELESLLKESNPQNKCERFFTFYESFQNDSPTLYECESSPTIFTKPAYADLLNIVPPQQVPKRKNLATDEGKAVLIHAIMHIEYSAIDLALDAAYRFRALPPAYYQDWLEVAHEEVRHFLMLQTLLHSLGYRYGDLPVHTALFDASAKTPGLLERMAIVPRYLEAQGLDSNLVIIDKLHRIDDSMGNEILKALGVILEEEVDHVSKGDRWFKYACKQGQIETSIYFDIVKSMYPNAFSGRKPLNKEARKKAGFSEDEIAQMQCHY